MNDYEELLKLHRRNLHMIPELDPGSAWNGKISPFRCWNSWTPRSAFLCGSGICAYFDKGQKETYGFRADMDGLPVQEANSCNYRSIHENRMHACGHDGHMAMVLTLGQYVDTLDELGCNVLLIFSLLRKLLAGPGRYAKAAS